LADAGALSNHANEQGGSMFSTFYKTHGLRVLLLVTIAFPVLHYLAETIRTNNDIEAWLPEHSEVRQTYEEFKTRFGAEEIILISLDRALGDDLIESVCGRIERLSGVRRCWSPQRMSHLMRDLGVSEQEIAQRLKGLFVSHDGRRVGVVATLSDQGIQARSKTVADIRETLSYCQLDGHAVNIAGAPVVIAELDRLGGRKNNKTYFLISLVFCSVLLYYQLRDWRLSGMILGLTVLAIQLTVAVLHLAGGEMNFVLNALPIMVMVLTLEVAVHLLNYWHTSAGEEDRFGAMLKQAFTPCFLATFTTAVGLVSLCMSQFVPVRQFGGAAALGAVIALVVGILLTPAVIAVYPPPERRATSRGTSFMRIADGLLVRSRTIVAISVVVLVFLGYGMTRLRSYIDPLKFLPEDNIVLQDVYRIRADLTNTDTIEAIVDFGRNPEMAAWPFVKKLEFVRAMEKRIAAHKAVAHTMSLADLFPTEMPNGVELLQLLKRASSRQQDNDYLAGGEQYWRISANIRKSRDQSQQRTFAELAEEFHGEPVIFTGIAPLIEKAQLDIYQGFWSSFMSAFGVITLIMMASLWWPKAGFIGMFPNIAPIAVVFGFLGWIDYPVDIGMMMSGSIALGIAVDGAFHMLVSYRKALQETGDKGLATRTAVERTGPPILQATLIMAIGMLALCFSSFGPTVKFGVMMFSTLLVSLLGTLILLPSLLGFFHTRRLAELAEKARSVSSVPLQGPHFWQWLQQRSGLRIFRAAEEDSHS
jgi:predicted RND superfamily exporter protein